VGITFLNFPRYEQMRGETPTLRANITGEKPHPPAVNQVVKSRDSAHSAHSAHCAHMKMWLLYTHDCLHYQRGTKPTESALQSICRADTSMDDVEFWDLPMYTSALNCFASVLDRSGHNAESLLCSSA
jgi:hypothetical protein